MAKKGPAGRRAENPDAARRAVAAALAPPPGRPSALLDTWVIYCGDCLEQLKRLPEKCIDLIGTRSRDFGIDPPFNSNRNYEVFRGETKERRARTATPSAGAKDFVARPRRPSGLDSACRARTFARGCPTP